MLQISSLFAFPFCVCIFQFTLSSQICPSFPLLFLLFLLSASKLLNWILIICPTRLSLNVTSSVTFPLISALPSLQPHPQKVLIKLFDLCSAIVGKWYLFIVLICIYLTSQCKYLFLCLRAICRFFLETVPILCLFSNLNHFSYPLVDVIFYSKEINAL